MTSVIVSSMTRRGSLKGLEKMKLSSWRRVISLKNMDSLSIHRTPAIHLTAPRTAARGKGIPHSQVAAVIMGTLFGYVCHFQSPKNRRHHSPKSRTAQNGCHFQRTLDLRHHSARNRAVPCDCHS